EPAGRRDRQSPSTLILGNLRVPLPTHHLKHIQPHAQRAEQQHDQNLDEAQPRAEVLRCIFELHGLMPICILTGFTKFFRIIFSSTVLSTGVPRAGALRTVAAVPTSLRRARPACKAPACRPLSSLLVYKTSSVQKERPADIQAPGARTRKS